jgi:transcriptional regulator with XRE-family HTH domain
MSVDIGERIRSLRMARGLSQEEVARRTGIGLKSYGDLERGRTRDPHYSTLRGVARALGVRVEELLEEPVPLDEAPQGTGPTEAEQQRPSLDQVREVFAPLADGLNHYCARWEEKLPSLQGTAEEVEDFFLDCQDLGAIILRVLEIELRAIAEALDLASRYGSKSGLPLDMRVGFIRGEAEQQSLMHEALGRYGAIGRALAESVRDEEKALRMRQALAEAGV